MRLAITIDAEHPDHPASDPGGNVRRVLDLLRARRAPATFFVQGAWAGAYPELVRRMAGEGHLVGSHSHRHCLYTTMSRAGILDDLERSRDALTALGVDPGSWFRLPSGSGSADADIMSAVHARGFDHVGWTTVCSDWVPYATAGEVVECILADVDRLRPDGVVVPVVHSWPDITPPALERVLEALAGSVELVRLDQLQEAEVPRG